MNALCKYSYTISESTLTQAPCKIAYMQTIGERIRARRKELKMTQLEVAAVVGVNRASVSQWETDATGIDGQNLLGLAKALRIPPEWIIEGKSPAMVRASGAQYDLSDSLKSLHEQQYIPLLSWVSAGVWLHHPESFSAGDAENWLPCPTAHSPMTFALRVAGESMTSPHPGEKSYPEGTIIYIDPDKPVTNGCRVVAYLPERNSYTFKKYVEDAGVAYLKPLNPTFETYTITPETEICGVLIGSYYQE